MEEEQIDLHLTEEDKINENDTVPQSNQINMEAEDVWDEVEKIFDTSQHADGTYSYLIKWTGYAEKA